jgi:hypothetical protein
MCQREITHPIVECREAVLSSLGHWLLELLGRFDQVVRNQRNKGERNNNRRDQGASHYDRQAIKEKACIARQH